MNMLELKELFKLFLKLKWERKSTAQILFYPGSNFYMSLEEYLMMHVLTFFSLNGQRYFF